MPTNNRSAPVHSSPKKALITGVTGQDGSYLAELLIEKGYEVHGAVRRSSSFNRERIEHIRDKIHLHYGDLGDGTSLNQLFKKIHPDEIYNLGAQSHVRVSFDVPEYTADVSGLSTLRILDAIRESGITTRFYQASSSEMFGSAPAPQDENTLFHPRSPYACAKVFAYHCTVNYREAYGLFACNGILFNHESPRRGENFVSRKITLAAARIKLGLQDNLHLGNLEARRDWGYAKDYVEAMWLMLQQDRPGDYVIATGESHSVREFLDEAFGILDLDWRDYVKTDSNLLRPSEVNELRGNASKAWRELNWSPSMTFQELVRLIVEADLKVAQREKALGDWERGVEPGLRSP